MKCTYGEHPWHTRIGCTAALDAEHYLQEIGALEGFYFPRIMEVNPSPVTPPAETLPSVQISVEHPNLATSIQYGVSSLPVRDEVRTGGFVTDNWINFLFGSCQMLSKSGAFWRIRHGCGNNFRESKHRDFRGGNLMYPINEVTSMNWLAAIHDGEVGSLPTIYLGLPLGAKFKSIEIWDSVIETC
ncbi:uncharacterized protein LOC114077870 isoform X2 [Solanum pennellii]|uniref:Uncharacterized protein LOC114077870 isoform X2 n=1 Tax=Solanum pennellii TaxID=28526 RepID=A0ABM1VE66_SOLPN|nr:uncharacterized protein LOC114077870 isoform X2 [Solanum pennellii]